MNFTIRQATADDICPALDLALRVFMEYEAPEYEPEGAVNFKSDIEWKAANLNLYLSGERLMFVAVRHGKIVGVIESNRHEHINMVFVDGAYHRQGIAIAMMKQMVCALKLRGSNKVTLNSSPYGLPFYLHFGFVPTDSEQRKDGFIFTPMVYMSGEIWFHGSPLELTELASGSTITQWKALAEALSHKPPMLEYDHVGGEIKHNGTLPGFLYVIDEPIVEGKDLYKHPNSSMDDGVEWLTKRSLKLRRIGGHNA